MLCFLHFFHFFKNWFDSLEPMIFRKQPLYPHEVVVRSTYALPAQTILSGISRGMLLFLTFQLMMVLSTCYVLGGLLLIEKI